MKLDVACGQNKQPYHLYLIAIVIFFCFVFPSLANAANFALQFDGTDDYVLLPAIEIGGVFSVECWFDTTEVSSFATLLKDSAAGSNFGTIHLNYDSELGTNFLEWWWGSNKYLYTSGLNNSTWYHLVLTADGAVANIYINGSKVASRTFNPFYNNTLGVGENDEGSYFNGKVDEVRIYSRALSASEANEHYQWQFNDETGLEGLWHFDEGSGEIASDASGKGNDGIIYGAGWTEADEIVPSPAAPPIILPQSLITNTEPVVSFTSIPLEGVWRGGKTISYQVIDNDSFPRGLISQPITIYYSSDAGLSWKKFSDNEPNSGTYTFDTTKLPDGPHYKIKIVATDGWGGKGETASDIFGIDNTGPRFTIAISSQAQPPIKEKDKINLEINSSEDLKKVPEIKIRQESAEPQALVVSGARKNFSATYTVLRGYPGTAVISIKGEDAFGNIGTTITAGETFSVGRLGPPPPVVESPANNQIFNESKINVSGKSPLAVEITLVVNGTEKFTALPDKEGIFIFKDIALSQANFGYNILTLFGVDKDGVQSSENVIKVKFNQPPQISLTSKITGIVSDKIKIEWLASDLNNDKLSYIIEYSLDGKNWDNLVSGLIENYYDFNPSELFDGSHYRLKITADDGKARSETISDEFAIETGRDLSVLNIPANYLINTTSPVFEGEISFSKNKTAFLKYSLNKQEWFGAGAGDGKFDSSLEKFKLKIPGPLIDGKYTLSILAEDDKGNSFKTFRMFIVDTVPPLPPSLVSPGPDEIMGKDKDIDPQAAGIQIDISGRGEAGAELELLIHDIKYQAVASDKGEFTFSKITLLSRGLNRFLLLSSDAVGNIAKLEGFIISNNPPEISILSPGEGDFIGQKKEIKWQADDKDDDSLVFQIFYRPKKENWISLTQNLSGNVFDWDTSKMALEECGLKITANDGLSETSAVIEKIFVDSRPPQINFDAKGPIFTKDVRFLFSGKALDDFSGVQDMEYSLDGSNWYKGLIIEGGGTRNAGFEFYHRPRLSDGDYEVRARATDGAGNVGYSEVLEITVNTVAPLIGSSLISKDSLLLLPDEDGFVRLFRDRFYKILASASSDAKELSLKIGDMIFILSFNKSTVLWEGEFVAENVGDYPLEITAKDKFDNSRSKKIADLKVLNPGFVFNQKNKERIKGARVSLYIFDQNTDSWLSWDAAAFGQKNPQETDESGQYDFLIPPGKYRLEIKAEGFEVLKSKDLEIKKNHLLNIEIPLDEKKGILKGLLKLFQR